MTRIYLDYNASTPIDPRVAEAMREAMTDGYGNPSNMHWAGTPAHVIGSCVAPGFGISVVSGRSSSEPKYRNPAS